MSAWSEIDLVAPADLADASLELYWAVQLLASAAHTFAEPDADQAHLSMTWNQSLRSFVGTPFAGVYPFRAALRPDDLTFMLLDRTDEALGALPLAGRSPTEAREWLSLGIATYLGCPPPVIGRPDYPTPSHPLDHGARFSTTLRAELGVLSALHRAAAELLDELLAGREDAGPIRCWPDRFRISASVRVNRAGDPGDAEVTGPAAVLDVGMAPMGDAPGWYWYVSLRPAPEPAALEPLESGRWHRVGWTGAVLPGSEVVALPSGGRKAAVRDFLEHALAVGRRVLGTRG